jgi:hypothetical protein
VQLRAPILTVKLVAHLAMGVVAIRMRPVRRAWALVSMVALAGMILVLGPACGAAGRPGSGLTVTASSLTLTPPRGLALAENLCAPAIEFTYVPAYASFEELQGRAVCAEPARHKVALYIYVSGWWTKPYWAWPLTPIGGDGRWTGGIVTSGTDQLATRIAAYLVPKGYDPPRMAGEQALPPELFAHAVARVVADRPAVFMSGVRYACRYLARMQHHAERGKWRYGVQTCVLGEG